LKPWIALGWPAIALLNVSCVHQTRATNLTPPAPTVWERQVHNAKDAGDGDYALRRLRERVAAEPENPAPRLELAAAYRERGYPDIALEMCRLAAARFPESGEVQLALARSLRDLNRRTEAAAGLQAFQNSHPQAGAELFAWIGILHDESGQWSDGETWHRRALELAPREDYLHNNLGYNLLMQNHLDDAEKEFHQALALNPSSATARNNLGLVLARRDASRDAVANWQTAGDAATAHNNLAVVLIEKGNYPEARKELQVALGYNRSLPAALKNLELVSRLDGNPATFPGKGSETGGGGWKSLKRLFVGPLDEPRKAAAKTESERAAGEMR
jgi:Flp pilus assembly protein TadD